MTMASHVIDSDEIHDHSALEAKLAPTANMMRLPPELHLLIISHLPYPDALSLKHSARYFYSIVHTGVELKIQWLIARRVLHLECPHSGQCVLKTDREFCRGSVRLLMQRRRMHLECGGGRGCLVLGTKRCEWRRERRVTMRIGRWWRGVWESGNVQIQVAVIVIAGLVGALLSILCLGLRAA